MSVDLRKAGVGADEHDESKTAGEGEGEGQFLVASNTSTRATHKMGSLDVSRKIDQLKKLERERMRKLTRYFQRESQKREP